MTNHNSFFLSKDEIDKLIAGPASDIVFLVPLGNKKSARDQYSESVTVTKGELKGFFDKLRSNSKIVDEIYSSHLKAQEDVKAGILSSRAPAAYMTQLFEIFGAHDQSVIHALRLFIQKMALSYVLNVLKGEV